MAKKKSNEFPTNTLGRLKQFSNKNFKQTRAKNNTAVIYNRCSSEEQDSLGWQDKLCEEFCLKRKFEVQKKWSEKMSAKTDDREAFQDMVQYVFKNKIAHIVFYSYSRFSRTGDFTLLNKLRANGTKIHGVSQFVDDETPSGRFTQKLFILFGEYDNDIRLDSVMEGMENKVRNGDPLAKVPIGYEKLWVNGTKQQEAEKKQTFVSKDGKLISQAFDWVLMNISQKEIIERLAKMGLKLKGPQLSRILRNPFYAGLITSSLLKEGEFIQGKHEPLVSLETFIKVNEILDGKNPHGWKMKKENDEVPLKIFVKCGHCGRSLSAYPQKGVYFYYKCPNTGCKINIKNTKLHELFTEKLSQFTLDTNLAPVLKEQLMATFWHLHDNEAAREKPLKDEHTRLKNDLEKMELNLATSVISFEIYSKFAPDFKRRIANIEQDLEGLSKNCANLESYIDSAITNSNNLLNIWGLLNYAGKQRLQYLVFPSGMTYFKENHQLRTDDINPIFQAISSFTNHSEPQLEPVLAEEGEGLRKVFLMFASANFLYNTFKDSQAIFDELSYYNPSIWEAMRLQQVNPLTGITETVEYKYASDSSGFILSGTPFISGDYMSMSAQVEVSLNGNGFSGAILYCSSEQPYVFTGLTEGSYTLAAYSKVAKSKYMSVDILTITGNTSYNTTLNPMN